MEGQRHQVHQWALSWGGGFRALQGLEFSGCATVNRAQAREFKGTQARRRKSMIPRLSGLSVFKKYLRLEVGNC